MAKGLDGNFLNYGIRKEDMEVIATLAEKHKLMPEWIEEEVLKPYHAAKTNDLAVRNCKSCVLTLAICRRANC